jgi:hypothetical protein
MADDKLLSIYLNDHWAGAMVGVELARRTKGNNEGNGYADALSDLCAEIEADRAELRRLMARLGVRPSRARQAGAVVSERLGRLKLNGRLVGYSPLSRLIELEGLVMGVTGKLELWRSLQATADSDPRLRDVDFKGLIRRAERQRSRLEELHGRAAREALAAER